MLSLDLILILVSRILTLVIKFAVHHISSNYTNCFYFLKMIDKLALRKMLPHIISSILNFYCLNH